jgi:hypothetical protein
VHHAVFEKYDASSGREGGIMKLMITCEEVSTLLSAEMDIPISTTKRILLRMHLMMCRKCTSVKQQILSMRKVFPGLEDASSKDEIKMTTSSRDRIKQTLLEQ